MDMRKRKPAFAYNPPPSDDDPFCVHEKKEADVPPIIFPSDDDPFCGHENRAKMAEMFGCRGLSAYLSGFMKKAQPCDLRL